MITPKFKHLFNIELLIGTIHDLGSTPVGERRIVQVKGGKFEGKRTNGIVLPDSAADWVITRNDRSVKLDVRLTLKTSDNALIFMKYEGLRHSSEDVSRKLGRSEKVDSNDYYYRTVPFFETSAKAYSWINNVVCVGLGSKTDNKVLYNVFEIL